ncbi:MAG: 1,4-alpha-glucan branching protein domain-containing protein [Candidatus Firestonebacteria bacterium]
MKGYLSLVLHAHLPYIRHPEHEDFLEEDWFYEAIFETYIPLLLVYERLLKDNVDFRVTMSLTPPLLSMLSDPLLQNRALHYIEKLVKLSAKEITRTEYQPEFNKVARMYSWKFEEARDYFLSYNKNLVSAFRKIQEAGKLEIITCCATHGYLPLMLNQKAVNAQIKVAVDTHKRLLGRQQNGIWLAECAYYPGVDYLLRDNGIKFFFVDTHGVLFAAPRPKYGIFAPVFCKSGVAAFARDVESSKQVWSAKEGYPGDTFYREFYRDVGFDLDFDYVRPFINADGTRTFTGMKYYRITGEGSHKEVYLPEIAMEKAAAHAGNFLFNREKQAEWLAEGMDRKPIIISPYDAELYGHWWYEGPDFLNFLFRKMHHDQDAIKMTTPSEYLAEYPRNQVCQPSESSWGYKGYHEVWLEGGNDWIYRHLHKAADRMCELAEKFREPDGLRRRALNQAARELLLAQASDWAFIMKTQTNVAYAIKKTKEHIVRFTRLYNDLKNNCLDEVWLADVESRDNIFPEIDYKVYG